MPALIRLLYGTGLRISEALALKMDDVNLDDNYLRVRDSKNGKERIIPISDSLTTVCREYVKYLNQLPLGKRKPGYFFVKLDGSKCGPCVWNWFRKCLDKAAIPYVGRWHGPRIHDLRHTFAVTSLAHMAEAGIDLYASLPILSNYLGHQSLKATDHYVRLTANMYPQLIKDVDMICLDVFPKFRNYEAD
jgi:integrase